MSKIVIVRRVKNEIRHSAKGSTWKDHKYIKKVGDKYVYADTQNGEGDEEDNKTTSSGDSAETEKEKTESSETDKDEGTEGEDSETSEEEFDLEEMANKVIRGEFGNGADRKELLGESYDEIQNRVNEILLGESYINKKLKEAEKSKTKDSEESKEDEKKDSSK